MTKERYTLLNNSFGWLAFLIAAVTYLLTLEPTASFWDCGEFIATSWKLQIGHPPGAPFFMLVGRFFSLFAPDTAHVALMINTLSGLASAFTILFLFWTITHLARKLVGTDTPTVAQTIAILGSGMVGALAYTFSDTFWFSAVEGEVYASSSLLTAIVFWAILKWENVADQPYANRWLVLIFYITGLSIGVHLLNLLAIPAIVLVYYFRKYPVTTKGIIISLAISVAILGFIMGVFIMGIVKVATWFELLFVNGFGLPYNTGVIIYVIALLGLIVWGIKYTLEKQKALWNTILLCFTMMLGGYSCYAIVVIRSLDNPPMDQNSPDNVFTLLSYLSRDQYGSRPLFFGQYYNSPVANWEETSPYYVKKDGKYVIADVRSQPVYDERFTGLLPRMWSTEHERDYNAWVDIKGTPVPYTDRNGERQVIRKPTFWENVRFFVSYQAMHMYVRYFMWNFVGRQNDVQGHGEINNGNWISGIDFLDAPRVGHQDMLPEDMQNKAHNTYFFLPLLLGLAGLFFQLNRSQRDFSVVALLFILTGIAIVVYLNQTPRQPRERDYAYAGSFYAFAIWIGLGVLALWSWLSGKLKSRMQDNIAAAGVAVLCLLTVPARMGAVNWDDHDRSNRYTARDFGADYLKTCEKDAVIFTMGDNDTFPLWYNQDVEGFRLDVRVCNLSYLQTDWYIDQMKRQAYDSKPLPISFAHDDYVQGTNDAMAIYPDPRLKNGAELKKVLEYVRKNHPRAFPTDKLFITVDKEAVKRNKVVPESMYSQIVDTIWIDLSGKQWISKDQLMVLDIVANSCWDRPVYFATTVGRENFVELYRYFMLEGFAYRFVPIRTEPDMMRLGIINTDKLYDMLMHKYAYGNMNDPKVYIDENNERMMMNIRNNFYWLADELVKQGAEFEKLDSIADDSALKAAATERYAKATESLDRQLELLPQKMLLDWYGLKTVELYYAAHQPDKAQTLSDKLMTSVFGRLDYMLAQNDNFFYAGSDDYKDSLAFLRELERIAEKYAATEAAQKLKDAFAKYVNQYQLR
ncbi:MAG: DUF2723 domain-containing protein [Bacteroidales bacterium]|nr:DUF2723 domain-containing protein [Bacteroidales bacterium]